MYLHVNLHRHCLSILLSVPLIPQWRKDERLLPMQSFHASRPVSSQFRRTEITALYQPAVWDRLRASRRSAVRAVWDGTGTWLEAHHQCHLVFKSPDFSPSLYLLRTEFCFLLCFHTDALFTSSLPSCLFFFCHILFFIPFLECN